jgi:hypothetical protein
MIEVHHESSTGEIMLNRVAFVTGASRGIGAAIAEALIVTGYGLMVAIPSVLVFNWLSGRIANYEAGLLNAGSELVDRLETTPDYRQQAQAQPQQQYYEQPAQPQQQYYEQPAQPQPTPSQQQPPAQHQPATRSGLPPRTVPSRLR